MYIVGLFIFFIIVLIYNNITFKVTNYTQYLRELPVEFDDFKIVQIADLHNRNFVKNQSSILKKIEKIKPNIIVFTGDLIDYNRFDEDIKQSNVPAIELIKGLNSFNIPMYMVYGNHEIKFKPDANNHYFMKIIQSFGVKVLNSEIVNIYKNNESINLLGIADPYMFIDSEKKEHRKNNYFELNKQHGEILTNELNKLSKNLNIDKTNILICHRPELLDIYSKYNLNLVLTGHAHGGQFRLPFIGGLYAPHQGKFPKYTSGSHTKDNTNLIVSRGLGNSSFPIRLNNRPEIVTISLKRDN